jgi:L-iditol 2-dehydrogenase
MASKSMRVAELTAVHSFRLIESTIDDPPPGHVQARVHAVGICGSDLHNFSEGSVGDMPSQFPMVLGHEPAGTVVKCGSGVTGWSEGDRVVLEPAIYCYHCEFCLSGRHNVCSNLRFLSQPNDPGFFRDYVNLPADNLRPVPSNLSLSEVTLFEPLAIILHSMRFVSLVMGESAAVFGAGPIGLLTIAVLRLAGAGRIYAIDPVAHRREMALKMGASAAFDPADAVHEILRDGRGVDVAVDCAGKGQSLNNSLEVTRNAGRVVVTAIPSEPEVTMKFHIMRRKELSFYNVRRSNREEPAALHMLSEMPSRFVPMITHRMPLDGIQKAFFTLESYADGVGKISVDITGD